MMHYVKSGDKRRRGQLEDHTQNIQELNPNTSGNYLLKSPCVCVCHHSSPSMLMVNKHCSYTFTPAFSFMACTGTALTSSSLGYRNFSTTTQADSMYNG